MPQASSIAGYSTREVARLLDLPATQIRSFARSGLLRPVRGLRGELRFSFQDLVVLRSAKGLISAAIPARRVRRALRRLSRQLTPARPLHSVRLSAEGRHIVAHQDAAAWEPESGQLVLDFEPPRRTGAADALRHRPRAGTSPQDASMAEREVSVAEHYHRGRELESTDPAAAMAAYELVLELDAGHGSAHLDLGRLLHEAGQPDAAEGHYRQATEHHPGDATAHFNLAVALQDLGRSAEAIEHYLCALEINPSDADTHFNLAGLYGELGRAAEAIQSFKRYRELIRD